ncbi:CesT family type III secretion system chaperone [Pseudomonas sp. GL-B-16]|uniref:CesT family type III secretion system chaperone n=1 Tax=Pseudomonas sp. GL-B-16 TaxID=2832373 RepID=UPI001CC0C314|nr:CesT family type III secretion system chaperone [Pseudomonas sp. GL-B-16]
MAKEHYRHLVDQICAHTLIPNPAALYHATNLAVRDIDFSLQYVDDSGHGDVAILCDFGELPDRRREEVMLRLLETNFYMSESPGAPMLSFNDQSQRVTLTCKMALQGLHAEVLLALMGQFSDMVKAWRSSYFLPAAPKPQRMSGHALNGPHSSALSTLR